MLKLIEWLPAISTTTLFALVLWLSRNLIITRLTSAIRHEYDKQIEQLKSDLKLKESQILTLQTGALAGIANRQKAIFEKQLNAVEHLWDCICALAPAKGVSAMMVSIKFEVASKEAAVNPEFREIFKVISNVNIDQFNSISASKVRPFISPLAWAYYSAYQAIVINAVARMHMLKNGIDMPNIFDTKNVENLIEIALPNKVEYIKKYGPSGFFYLLEELESSLLIAFKLMLDGETSDQEALTKAARMIKASEKLMSSTMETSNQSA